MKENQDAHSERVNSIVVTGNNRYSVSVIIIIIIIII